MVNCAYCDAKLDRLVFCNSSHKVMYHRDKITSISKTSEIPGMTKTLLKTDQNNPQIKEYVRAVQKAKSLPLCKHGSMIGLCRFNCKS